ncbi:MAG: hypothetical protein U0163_11115 [Gemmatimonadaceae bacterium]
MTSIARGLCCAACLVAAPLLAQEKLPPVRPLGAVEVVAREPFGAVSATRALPGGRLLVNDIIGRRVVLMDSSLANFSVVADTTSATANAYSSRFGGLIPFRGDSTLFVDPTSLSMLVIDGAGAVGRVMSIPRPNDATSLIGGPSGTPAFDGNGRLVYRAAPLFRFGPGGGARPGGQAGARGAGEGGRGERTEGGPPRAAGGAPFQPPALPDSLPIVRVELATRTVDTVAHVKVARPRMTVAQDSGGRMRMSSIIDPLPITDDWAVLSDGSIAVVRGQDYHVDWVRPDGSRSSSARIPFQWRHLSDSDKVAFLDSTKAAMEKVRAQFQAQRAANGGTGPIVPPPGADGLGGVGGGQVMFIMRGDFGGERGGEGRGGEGPRPRNEGGGVPTNFTLPPLQFVAPNELPDYAPPFTAGAAKADMDGHLWIRTTYTKNGGPVYDVLDGSGALLDRVVLPPGRVIAGFAPGGVVYMGVRDGATVHLERARRTQTATQ